MEKKNAQAQSEIDKKANQYMTLREQLFRFGNREFFEIIELNIDTSYFEHYIKKLKLQNLRSIISKSKTPVTILSVIFQKISGSSCKFNVNCLSDAGENYKCEISLVMSKNTNKVFIDHQNPLFQVERIAKARIETLGRALAKEIFGWRILEVYFHSIFNFILEHYPSSNLMKLTSSLTMLRMQYAGNEQAIQSKADLGTSAKKLIGMINSQNALSSKPPLNARNAIGEPEHHPVDFAERAEQGARAGPQVRRQGPEAVAAQKEIDGFGRGGVASRRAPNEPPV